MATGVHHDLRVHSGVKRIPARDQEEIRRWMKYLDEKLFRRDLSSKLLRSE
jgi:hypothetical protein